MGLIRVKTYPRQNAGTRVRQAEPSLARTIAGKDRVDRRDCGSGLIERRNRPIGCTLHERGKGASEDIPLVLEVLIQGWPGHACRLGNMSHRSPSKAPSRKDVDLGRRNRRPLRGVRQLFAFRFHRAILTYYLNFVRMSSAPTFPLPWS
jgi:hypothetical protein